MAYEVKGAKVDGRNIVGDLFDVSVEVIYRANVHDRATLVFTRTDNGDPLAQVITFHPDNWRTSADNWADLLMTRITTRKSADITIAPAHVSPSKTYRVSSQPNLGMKFFRFHRPGNDYAIVVEDKNPDNHNYMPGIVIPHVTSLSDENVRLSAFKVVDRGTFVRATKTTKDGEEETTIFIAFKESLSARDQMEIYLNRHNIRKYMTREFVDLERSSLVADKGKILWKRIGNMDYIESFSGDIRFTFYRDPLSGILRAASELDPDLRIEFHNRFEEACRIHDDLDIDAVGDKTHDAMHSVLAFHTYSQVSM